MTRGVGGGWQGTMGMVGGVTRTYGLQNHFSKEGMGGPPPQITSEGLRRVGRYFRPYLKKCTVVLLCTWGAAGLSVLPPLCVRWIIDRAIPQADKRLLVVMTLAMVGLAVAAGLVGVLQQTLTAIVGQSIMNDLRRELFAHLQRLSLRFYTTNRSGEIVSRINNDVNAVQTAATGTLSTIAGNVALLAAASIAMFATNWQLALLATSVVPFFYLPSKVVGGIRRRLSAQTQASQASLQGFLNERLHVGGSLLMNIFGQRQADDSAFAGRSSDLRDLNIKQAVVGRWLFMILSVFSMVGPALVYWYGGLQVMRSNGDPSRLEVGQLVAFAAWLTLLYRPMVQLATVYVDIQGAMAVFDRIFAYLDLKPDVSDKPHAAALARTQGQIVLEDVGFAYPPPPVLVRSDPTSGNGDADAAPADRFALRDVNFLIKPGQRIALVGPSGAGKTTITYLVPRFYDPDQGRILLDGHDLRDLQQESLRRHIGIVTQETFLFHATIRENLLYARPGATSQQMIDACRAANIHDLIASLPERYDTVVGERGFRLSGGEKQRISMARALLKDPAILILDEATSNLDATSEFLIQQALEILLQGRTSLIIAHRLSTILSCDQIVVMEAGRVADIGRHEDLLDRGGLYAKLFEQQFGKVLGRTSEPSTATAAR